DSSASPALAAAPDSAMPPPGGVMTEAEIHSRPYALTKADYIAYYLSTYLRGFVTFPAAVFMWLAAFGPGAAWVLITLEQGHHVRALLIALGVAAVWLGVLT